VGARGYRLQPNVGLPLAKRKLEACRTAGEDLLREGVDLATTLAGSHGPTEIIARQDVNPWIKKQAGWLGRTREELAGLFDDSSASDVLTRGADRARTAQSLKELDGTLNRSRAALGSERAAEALTKLRVEREALRGALAELRGIEDSLTGDRVMVIHGRNQAAQFAMFNFLKRLGLEPITWEAAVKETRKGAPHNLEAVRAAMDSAQVVVALFSPDDMAFLRPELTGAEEKATGQPRPNVLIETGMAMALKAKNTIVVHLGRIRPASDLDGLNYVVLPRSLQGLRERLQNQGCRIDASEGWDNTAEFSEALQVLETASKVNAVQ
jgi:predicted nucleotide-binding protein